MLSSKDMSRHWLVGSMTRGARRCAMAISGLTLAVSLAGGGALYAVGSSPEPSLSSRDAALLTQTTTDGSELIVDDAVPLAAGPRRQSSVPTAALLGGALVVAGGYFALRIHQVDANISTMQSKVC